MMMSNMSSKRIVCIRVLAMAAFIVTAPIEGWAQAINPNEAFNDAISSEQALQRNLQLQSAQQQVQAQQQQLNMMGSTPQVQSERQRLDRINTQILQQPPVTVNSTIQPNDALNGQQTLQMNLQQQSLQQDLQAEQNRINQLQFGLQPNN